MVSETSAGDLSCWKYSQLTCYLVAFIGGVVSSATLGTVLQKFDGRCPLYTKIPLTWFKSDNSSDIHVDANEDDAIRLWEAQETCDFSIFTAVGAAIYAFILAYFILMCDRTTRVSHGSGSHNRMTNLFFPLLITSSVFAILMLVSSVRVLNGTHVFCDSIRSSLNISCSEAQYHRWIEFVYTGYFYDTLLASLIASWVSTCAYILSIIILLSRCCLGVDYTIGYVGKLVESGSENSMSKNYGSAEHSLRSHQVTSSLPISKDFEPQPGPSSSSI